MVENLPKGTTAVDRLRQLIVRHTLVITAARTVSIRMVFRFRVLSESMSADNNPMALWRTPIVVTAMKVRDF